MVKNVPENVRRYVMRRQYFFLNSKQMLHAIDLFSVAQSKQYYSMPCKAQRAPNIRHEYEFNSGRIYDKPLQLFRHFSRFTANHINVFALDQDQTI